MDDKVAGHCQNCDRPVGPNAKNENGKDFCTTGCVRDYRRAVDAHARGGRQTSEVSGKDR